jgi:hypothetical protein
MSWVATWLDRAVYPGLAECQRAAAAVGGDVFNIYLGGRNAYAGGGGWSAHVSEFTEAGFGVFGTWVSLYRGQGGYALGYQDGVDADAAAGAAGVGLTCYDVEPDVWYANTAGVADACRGFRDALRDRGRPSMLYGLQGTLYACPGFDRYWGTFDLGQYTDDPARGAGPDGSRALQYVQTDLYGVDWDISHSEFAIGAQTGGQVFLDQPSQGGDAMSLLSTPAGRLDFVHVGVDGNVFHRWKNVSVNDLAAQNESWGSPPGVPLVRCEAAYDDSGSVITVLGVAGDGSVWACQRNLSDGSVHNDWFALDPANLRVFCMPGPKGDPGPAGPPAPPHTHPLTGTTGSS